MRDRQPVASTRDLDTRGEIAEMVRRFYTDVAQDALLGPMFDDVAKVDWAEHIDKLTDFWSRALLELPGYTGNPLRAHQLVHRRCAFTEAHFEQWLSLFNDTLEGWKGPRTERARQFAATVARAHRRQLLGRSPAPVP